MDLRCRAAAEVDRHAVRFLVIQGTNDPFAMSKRQRFTCMRQLERVARTQVTLW